MLVALMLVLVAQDVRIRDAGAGFRAKTHVPNLTARDPNRTMYVARRERWMPFQVTIENSGSPVKGILTLREEYEELGHPVVFQTRVSLPTGASKKIAFPVAVQSTAPLVLTLEDEHRGRLDQVIVRQPVNVGPAARLMLIVTRSASNFVHFVPRRGEELVDDRVFVTPAPADLPRYAIEYDGVDAVALDDLGPDSLSDEQRSALAQYVARGGHLVVAIQRNAPALGALLPSDVGELVNLAAVPALARCADMECTLERPTAFVRLKPREGATTWDADPSVIVHRPWERGLVTMLGFSLSARFLETWPGAGRFVESLLDAVTLDPILTYPGDIAGQSARGHLAVALKGSMLKTIPPFGTVMWILIGYAVVVLVLPYLVFRRLKRLEWAWSAVGLFAVVGTGVVYATGVSYLESDSSALCVSVVEGGGESGPLVRHNYWSIFSARGDRIDLSFEGRPIAFPLGHLSSRSEPMTVSFDDDVQIRRFRTYYQDSVQFETTDAVRLPGRVWFEAQSQGDDLSGLLGPSEKISIGQAWVFYQDGCHEIEPGKQFTLVPKPRHRPTPKGDLFFRRSFEALYQVVSLEAQRRKMPLVLFTYSAAPMLKNSSLKQRYLHFGLLRPRSWPTRLTWELRPAENLSRAQVQGIGVECLLTIRNLSQGTELASITPLASSYVEVEVYNRKTGHWQVFDRELKRISDYAVASPLGSRQLRLRVRSRWGDQDAATVVGNVTFEFTVRHDRD